MNQSDQLNQTEQLEQLEQLRTLLLSADRAELKQLKAQLEKHMNAPGVTPTELAAILPAALDLRSGNDQALANALAEPVSTGLKRSIAKEPKFYGDILYPVLAPAIRKAIAQAMSSLVATIQRTLESTTTASGIAMRIKSLTTGIPYAELALLKSLVFRVEHIYLIERETGILIKQLSDPSAHSLDSDAVGAMFSAIESFVHDSFANDQDDRLTDLKVGERNVWVAHGPQLMLACVIFGDAPESLKDDLYDALDRIRVAYAHELSEVTAGALQLQGVGTYLEPILQSQVKQADKTFSIGASTTLALLLFLGLCGYGVFHLVSAKLEFNAVRAVFAAQPGLLVTDIQRVDDYYAVFGLRDPQVQLPVAQLAAIGVDDARVVFKTQPYISLEPEVEINRFMQRLRPPAGVQIVQHNQELRLLGVVPLEWAEQYTSALIALDRDGRLSLSGLEISQESVRQTLVENFSVETLASARLVQRAVDGLNVQLIEGDFNEEQRSELSRYFANSVWVKLVKSEVLEPSESAEDNSLE